MCLSPPCPSHCARDAEHAGMLIVRIGAGLDVLLTAPWHRCRGSQRPSSTTEGKAAPPPARTHPARMLYLQIRYPLHAAPSRRAGWSLGHPRVSASTSSSRQGLCSQTRGRSCQKWRSRCSEPHQPSTPRVRRRRRPCLCDAVSVCSSPASLTAIWGSYKHGGEEIINLFRILHFI